MDYQKPVYKSKGVPQKVKAVYQIAIILFTIIGIILVFLPIVSDAPSFSIFLGIIYLAFAFLLPKVYFSMNNSRIHIFNDHVAGIAVHCIEADSDKLFPKLNYRQEDLKFTLPFSEITNVQKGAPFFSQIIITYGDKKFQVATKDMDKVYHILCDNIFGQISANNCISCGHEIGSTTESCPHCGHITRYGKIKEETAKKHSIDNKLQIQSIIWAVLFVIGLMILIPAAIDLNEISDYAGLYASIYPSRAKKIVAKFILGLFLTCSGASYPLVKILLKKITPPQG
ncbi:MAG: hypothetical protein IJ422_08710 [Oscillospiraceae bacterium]|nr:hypothetical protein [Oscillospiraceae bacterium]